MTQKQYYCRNAYCTNKVNSKNALCRRCSSFLTKREKDNFYNTKAWKNVRRYKLKIDPLCEECLEKKLNRLATEVDHVIPIKDSGAKLSLSNLRSLCKRHHSQKTKRDNN